MGSGVYKRTKDKGRKGVKWVCWFSDERGKRKTCPGYVSHAASLERARKLEIDAGRIRDGIVTPSQAIRSGASRRPLEAHVEDFREHLLAKGCVAKHAREAARRTAVVLALAGVKALDQIAADAVQAALAKLREDHAVATVNGHRNAVRAFVRWVWHNRRIAEYPLHGLKGFNEEGKRAKRSLSVDEIRRLLAHVESSPPTRISVRGQPAVQFPGPDRAMLYRLALGTGFRANELRSLVPESFRLDAEPPSVRLSPAIAKNRKGVDQPIRHDLAGKLRPWLMGKAAGKPVVPVPQRSAELLQRDLKAAGIPITTADGDAVFHSLRITFATLLVQSGANIKTVQVLLRHASPVLTLQIYARSIPADRSEAIEALPQMEGDAS